MRIDRIMNLYKYVKQGTYIANPILRKRTIRDGEKNVRSRTFFLFILSVQNVRDEKNAPLYEYQISLYLSHYMSLLKSGLIILK